MIRLPLEERHDQRTRVLVVDDEPAIHRFLPALEVNEYEVSGRNRQRGPAENRLRCTRHGRARLGLPDMDGKDVIARVREWSDVPIIVLSARDREAEKIAALDLGADDFVNKPFGMGELMARLRTALRHRMQRKGETPVVSVGGLQIDIPRRRVTVARWRCDSQPEGVRPSRLPGDAMPARW